MVSMPAADVAPSNATGESWSDCFVTIFPADTCPLVPKKPAATLPMIRTRRQGACSAALSTPLG